jgi:hypothetical protein
MSSPSTTRAANNPNPEVIAVASPLTLTRGFGDKLLSGLAALSSGPWASLEQQTTLKASHCCGPAGFLTRERGDEPLSGRAALDSPCCLVPEGHPASKRPLIEDLGCSIHLGPYTDGT